MIFWREKIDRLLSIIMVEKNDVILDDEVMGRQCPKNNLKYAQRLSRNAY